MSSKKKSNNRKKQRKKNSKKRFLQEISKELGITFLIVFLLLFILSNVVFALPKNEGYGMREALNDGDRVYVDRLGKPKRFSLIYFKQPDGNGTSIRRVIGLPGERVRYHNDELYIDDRLVVERFLQKKLVQAKLADQVITEDFDSIDIMETNNGMIPKGKYLVLGDNRNYATDSRYYGLVDEQAVIGKVELRLSLFQLLRK
ncbi:signal peptidase I [Enterococcus haemoperoxidus ATCC BAA-382]|uniref:Signal peptidase I n=1 Tax=Enterococcus haemoperoxidus ATCC BAA-382 TaxID=1158608 RepID=R2QJL7_9ENTE|nr:signal peptidase I [Enterococcus haemoperoxidus]EOH96792.1 signal peptidase I [Enterococcus haemoperoxidus ATCC BAA-382]EOT60081.1 signal peptidase I [Enterococcus haemoperoxidus ATCC BAA-382]OJG51492.1 signal peptidase I [Enterococcus haemoperoxidus]